MTSRRAAVLKSTPRKPAREARAAIAVIGTFFASQVVVIRQLGAGGKNREKLN
jgi:hypothetical protein